MDLAIVQDIRKLMAVSEDIKQALEVLEEDSAVWARRREEKDLTKLIGCVKELETDISTMMSHFVAVSRRDKGGGITEGCCRWARYPPSSSATSDANTKRWPGCFAISLSMISTNHSGTFGLTSKIGRGLSSQTRRIMATVLSARNGGRPVHIA